MAAPTKPWEAVGVNFRSDMSPLSIQSSSKVPDINVRTMSSAPPPLPPRPSSLAVRRTTSNTGIIGGSHVYRGYPSSGGYVSGYGGYGGYGSLGMYGTGYGGYGSAYTGYPYAYQTNNDNRLVALAEERTRPAFESIESVVRAFGSVSFMLESTLGALHASFRAALGVADHLSHLRNILSALSIFRLLQWCLRQLRRLFGLKHKDAAFGGVWGEAAKIGNQVGVSSAPSPAPSQWPLRAFIGVVISGSYLAWRLLSFIVGPGGPETSSPFKGEESEPWVQGRDPGCQFAVACYNFTAALHQELSFCAGDLLIIAPKTRQPTDCREWMLAAHLRSSRQPQQNPPTPIKVGLVPSNYVRLVEKRLRQGVHQMPGVVKPCSPVVLAPPPTTLPTAAHAQPIVPPTPPPIIVDPLPVDLQAMQPLNTAAHNAPEAMQMLKDESRGLDSNSKAVDGGEDA